MDDLLAHAMGLFYLSPLLIPAFFCLRWAYRNSESDTPRPFFITLNVIVALVLGVISFFVYGLFVGEKTSRTNWNTGKPYRTEERPQRTEYTERCSRFVGESLNCSIGPGSRDLGFFDNGHLVSTEGKSKDDLASYPVRSRVVCSGSSYNMNERYIPEAFLPPTGQMVLDESLKEDTRLYSTCNYSFICETKELQTTWDVKIVSGKLETFGVRPQRVSKDPIWRPDEWEDVIPATQKLCRRILYEVNKAKE